MAPAESEREQPPTEAALLPIQAACVLTAVRRILERSFSAGRSITNDLEEVMRWTAVVLAAGSCFLGGCSASVGVSGDVEAGVVAAEERDEGSDRVWVCHRGRWQEVAAPASDAHSRHGDRVSSTTQEARGSC